MPTPINSSSKHLCEKNPTQPLILDLPQEYLDLCKRDGVSPEEVLRCFIADLCGIEDLLVDPRDDGYNNSGSDERMYASQYYERCGYEVNNQEQLANYEKKLLDDEQKLIAELEVFEQMEEELSNQLSALSAQHDANGTVAIEDEAWFPNYATLETRQSSLTEAIDRIEKLIADIQKQREVISEALYR